MCFKFFVLAGCSTLFVAIALGCDAIQRRHIGVLMFPSGDMKSPVRILDYLVCLFLFPPIAAESFISSPSTVIISDMGGIPMSYTTTEKNWFQQMAVESVLTWLYSTCSRTLRWKCPSIPPSYAN